MVVEHGRWLREASRSGIASTMFYLELARTLTFMIPYKYPRTMHLPWSPGTSSDDRIMPYSEVVQIFEGKEVVVTEKLDGENTNMYRDYFHVRSTDSRSHASQSVVRQLHGTIAHEIPEGWRICGENMYAKHSIFYDRLNAWFYVFSIWDENNIALSWDDTKEFAGILGLATVPELYRGIWNEQAIQACWIGKSKFGEEQEGYVVRLVDPFPYPKDDNPDKNIMPVFTKLVKYVRAKHVRTTDDWRNSWTPNKMSHV